jgi:hypothetical protein
MTNPCPSDKSWPKHQKKHGSKNGSMAKKKRDAGHREALPASRDFAYLSGLTTVDQERR